MRKHKKKLIGLLLIVFFGIGIKYCFFNKTEFIVIEHMTKADVAENDISEYILVKNPPQDPYQLKKMIKKFAGKRKTSFANIHQLYIKEHDYVYLPRIILAFWLTENYSYLDPKTSTDELNNEDFLATREKYSSEDKIMEDTIEVWKGNYCYYKK